MRIAHVNADRGVVPGAKKGAAVHVEAMRLAFARAGADVLEVDEPDPRALHVRLEHEHARRPIALVYERYALGAHEAGELARKLRIPHVLEVNAPLAEEEARHRPDRVTSRDASRERAVFSTATRVLCVSNDVRRYAIGRGAIPDRTVVQPNAVDPDIFRPRVTTDPLRSELIPAGRVALGFHGRLRPWHGFERLVAAFASLVARGAPVHLLVLGEGDFDAHLAGRVSAERVTRVGWRPHAEAARVVACTDVLPLTYPVDAPCYFSPLKLLEAMACAVVPVVPDLGDLQDAVAHGREGLVYRADREEELVQALELLVCDVHLRARLGAGARARADTCTWDRVVTTLLESLAAGSAT